VGKPEGRRPLGMPRRNGVEEELLQVIGGKARGEEVTRKAKK
jgi:hypothetical protein